jgi:hypothetical protein
MTDATKPHEVCIKGSDKTIGYACPTCHLFCSPLIYACKWEDALKAAYQHATTCCADRMCSECGENMGSRSKTHWLLCASCRSKKEAKREVERFREAKKIPLSEYTLGFLYCLERFWDDADLLLDEYAFDDEERPEYAWACEPFDLAMDATDLVSSELEHSDHHEDAFDEVSSKSLARLQRYLDAWCKHVAVRSWAPDYRVAVLLPRAEEDRS